MAGGAQKQHLVDMVDGEDAPLRHLDVLLERQPQRGHACCTRALVRQALMPIPVDQPADDVGGARLELVQRLLGPRGEIDEPLNNSDRVCGAER